MSKFNFKLESLLNIKSKFEDQAKQEYGKAIAQLEEEKNILLNLENKKYQNILNFKQSISKGINPDYIRNINQFIVLVDKQIKDQVNNIKKAEDFVEQQRQVLLTAMKEKKVLESLKEKKKEEYLKEQIKEEQKIIDEIVSYKYNKV